MKFFRNITYALIGAATIGLAASCQDDPLLPSESNNQYVGTLEEPFISFDLNLGSLENDHTSIFGDEFEKYENFIDPSLFRVLFFDKDDKFLLEVRRENISVIKTSDLLTSFDDSKSQCYRVTLSERIISNIGKDYGYDDEQVAHVREAIFDQGFKVAVLANWPTFVDGPRIYDETTGDPLIFNTGAEIATDRLFLYGDDLSKLSHCIYDAEYGDSSYSFKNNCDHNLAYKHITTEPAGEGSMGVYSVWVSNFFDQMTDVDDIIRAGVDRVDSNGQRISFYYSHSGAGKNFKCMPYSYHRELDALNSYTFDRVWRVWNFSAGLSKETRDNNSGTPQYTYFTTTDAVAEYWHARNQYWFVDKLNEDTELTSGFNLDELDLADNTDSGNRSRYVPYDETNGTGGYLVLGKSFNYPKIVSDKTDEERETAAKEWAKTFVNDQGSQDKLPNDQKVTINKNRAIHFQALGEGTLRIKCRLGNEAGRGRLLVVGDIKNQARPLIIPKTLEDGTDVQIESDYIVKPSTEVGVYEYTIDPSSKQFCDVYIYAIDGNIQIYEIDYIRGRHLYDTGRSGVMPSPTNPIPMYGIQEFAPIRKYVERMRGLTENGVFNMSDESLNVDGVDQAEDGSADKYPYRRVYLLRSLAKVEVLFKESVFKDHKPTHLYLRMLNRSARCEPMDVSTPTEVLWYGSEYLDKVDGLTPPEGYASFTAKYDPSVFVGVDQEFRNIKAYGPIHSTSNTGLGEFQKFTSWYFGAWTQTANPWGWNDENKGSTNNEGQAWELPEDNNLPYPRIFNSRIERSDYCRFVYVGTQNGYMRYVLYVPEKNIDDADVRGDRSARPKVCHMEIRLEGMNDNYNMDDDNTYRVYFADYGADPFDDFSRADWDLMEQEDPDGKGVGEQVANALRDHCYPIIRNHVYRFTINSINKDKLGVDFTICTNANRNAPSINFN